MCFGPVGSLVGSKRLKLPHLTSHQSHRIGDTVPWTRPEANPVDCNVDASLFDDGRFGIGLCICNEDGKFVKAKTVCFTCNPDPQEAEALSLLEAVTWLQKLGIQRVTIELDCKVIVDGIGGECNFVTEYGSILRSCQTLLSSSQNYKVSFILRQTRALRQYASSRVFLW